jgi:hypothetical protein
MMTERSGVEIDYCPTCRGVWLDRGELDKLIERTAVASPPSPAPAAAVPAQPMPAQPYPARPSPAQPAQDQPQKRWYDDDDDDDDWDDRRRNEGYRPDGYKYKKKSKTKSLLGEIFDF